MTVETDTQPTEEKPNATKTPEQEETQQEVAPEEQEQLRCSLHAGDYAAYCVCQAGFACSIPPIQVRALPKQMQPERYPSVQTSSVQAPSLQRPSAQCRLVPIGSGLQQTPLPSSQYQPPCRYSRQRAGPARPDNPYRPPRAATHPAG